MFENKSCRLNLETCPGLDVLLLVLDWILIRTRVSEPNLCVRRKTLHCFPPDWAEIHLRKEQLWKEEFVLVLWPPLDLMKMIHSLNLKGKASISVNPAFSDRTWVLAKMHLCKWRMFWLQICDYLGTLWLFFINVQRGKRRETRGKWQKLPKNLVLQDVGQHTLVSAHFHII